MLTRSTHARVEQLAGPVDVEEPLLTGQHPCREAEEVGEEPIRSRQQPGGSSSAEEARPTSEGQAIECRNDRERRQRRELHAANPHRADSKREDTADTHPVGLRGCTKEFYNQNVEPASEISNPDRLIDRMLDNEWDGLMARCRSSCAGTRRTGVSGSCCGYGARAGART